MSGFKISLSLLLVFGLYLASCEAPEAETFIPLSGGGQAFFLSPEPTPHICAPNAPVYCRGVCLASQDECNVRTVVDVNASPSPTPWPTAGPLGCPAPLATCTDGRCRATLDACEADDDTGAMPADPSPTPTPCPSASPFRCPDESCQATEMLCPVSESPEAGLLPEPTATPLPGFTPIPTPTPLQGLGPIVTPTPFPTPTPRF